jgi:hypothetical protein
MERKSNSKFTPEVIAMFRRMVVLHKQCQCGADDCAACSELDDLDDKLGDELIRTPWGGGPTVVWPEFKEPFASQGTFGAEWRRDEGPALYRELCKAAGVSLK